MGRQNDGVRVNDVPEIKFLEQSAGNHLPEEVRDLAAGCSLSDSFRNLVNRERKVGDFGETLFHQPLLIHF